MWNVVCNLMVFVLACFNYQIVENIIKNLYYFFFASARRNTLKFLICNATFAFLIFFYAYMFVSVSKSLYSYVHEAPKHLCIVCLLFYLGYLSDVISLVKLLLYSYKDISYTIDTVKLNCVYLIKRSTQLHFCLKLLIQHTSA